MALAADTFAAWEPFLLALVFSGLALLAVGYVSQHPRRHLLRIGGWALFAAYWPFQAPHYFYAADPDPVNGWFTLLGPLFIGYIAYHEWLSWKWQEDPKALRWFTGATVIASATYFVIYKSPAVQDWLIYVVAVHSAWLLSALFGVDNFVIREGGAGGAIDSHIYLAGNEYAVTVILACTAVQSIMIFVGAIACLDADRKRKWKGYAVVVPVIYFLNMFRNAGIVYGYKILEWNPLNMGPAHPVGSWRYATSLADGSFLWMHSYVGKFGSLAALIVIAVSIFNLLPELHSNILDLFDLRHRRKPGYFDQPLAKDPKAAARTAPGKAAVASDPGEVE